MLFLGGLFILLAPRYVTPFFSYQLSVAFHLVKRLKREAKQEVTRYFHFYMLHYTIAAKLKANNIW